MVSIVPLVSWLNDPVFSFLRQASIFIKAEMRLVSSAFLSWRLTANGKRATLLLVNSRISASLPKNPVTVKLFSIFLLNQFLHCLKSRCRLRDAPRIARQYALFLATGKIEGSIKEDWSGYAIGQDNHVVPVGILSLQRKNDDCFDKKRLWKMGNK